MVDHRVGGLQDGAGGAVVLLQPHRAQAGEVLAETADILDLGAAPAVDRLVVVTDDGDAGSAAGQQPQPGVLDGVGVLKLVDQNMPETSLIMPS